VGHEQPRGTLLLLVQETVLLLPVVVEQLAVAARTIPAAKVMQLPPSVSLMRRC
jgi:hypothetical protein